MTAVRYDYAVAVTSTNASIFQELKDLKANPLDNVAVEPKDDNLFEWNCSIKAASDSPYRGGTFHFTLSLPTTFPFKAPLVTFKTKIYHPGINDEGAICVPVLRDEASYSTRSAAGLDPDHGRIVLAIIQEKLNNPSADDPFEPDIAAVLKNDRAKFLATAREQTKNKKSETGRSQVPFISSEADSERDGSPQIPLPNDFRTSLILPDLSRRFSLLRSSSGEPVALDVLRGRLADHRARGTVTQISEEEEELIFDTLRSFRSDSSSTGQRSEENMNSTSTDDLRPSSNTMQSPLSPSSPSSVTSSPSSRSAKRYSNNLFGSGRFNDYNYMRSVTKSTSSRTASLTPTESSYRRGNTSSVAESLRPVTPDSNRTSSTSVGLSPIESELSVRSAPLLAPTPYGEQQPLVSVAEYRISKQLGPSALKRASMALEAVIKEFEEEAEDEILMPRSTPVPRPPMESPQPSNPERSSLSHSSIFEAVMAISSDKPVQNDPEVVNRRSSPVPSRILPGYVPGMPRPMTPREFDLEEQRSLSTTPRATSPNVSSLADSSVAATPISSTGRRRSNSSASQLGSRSPTSPLFLQRSPNNGRFTPEDGNLTESEGALSSSLLSSRRRPASPLAGPAFQPMTVSSRPTTPSTVVWNTDLSQSGHTRNDSWASDISSSNIHGAQNAYDRYTSGNRNVHSPPLPDSPIEGGGLLSALEASFNSMNKMSQNDAFASPSGITDLGSPRRAPQRSVTPTQSAARSPTSPTFPNFSNSTGSLRSSKQSPPSASVPPLVFSPLVNSSRSSLESAGSSYHTWDAGDEDRSSLLFHDPDSQPSVWHDLSTPATSVPADSPDENWNPEEVVARITGLKKSDFLTIQEKLLNAKDAREKEKETGRLEPQERAASSLRKRRPSTSQSNYSYNGRDSRVASPPPQIQVSPSKSSGTPSKERPSSALGNNASPSSPREKQAFNRDRDISPTARRNRDLAQALFGREEAAETNASKPDLVAPQPKAPITPVQVLKTPSTNTDTQSSTSTLSPTRQAPYQTARNPSVPRIPQTPQEEAQLVQEVKERIDAATEFLKPSKTNGAQSPDPLATISRKRINPNQISTPRLVSASTTVVDTIPIKAPSISSATSSGPSKIGSRFKKLRGTLRAKNSPPTDEISPFPLDSQSLPAIQVAHYDAAKLKVPASATEARFKVPVPSPPASAGPGLKGFMARFRGKQRPAVEPTPAPAQAPLMSPQSPSPVPPASLNEKSYSQASSMTIGRKPAPSSRPESPQVQSRPSPETTPHQATFDEPGSVAEVAESSDMMALRQLFEAANRIGIDQGELTSLLARSGSTSSKADWTALARSNSAVRQGAASTTDATPSNGRPIYDAQSMRALTPDPKTFDHDTGRRSLDGPGSREKPVSRQVSRKQADHTRRPREGKTQGDNSAVLRKTIIVPDTNMTADELKTFMEKSMPGRRLSVTSISSRSVHERAPTPPPPRSSTHKRFSGPSPPVPSLPSSLGNGLNVPSAAAGGSIEKSNSTYDSLYDMYSGETRSPSTNPNEPGPLRPSQDESAVAPDSGAAVELIHLANGETIWNIVNGLREDDDDESLYTRRTSFASEYGPRGTNGDGLQVFVKEHGHGRSGSKGSTSSFISRKRSQGKARPETKVFYTPAEGIGRLIHDLSQNMEAGSFNFAPRQGVSGHSPSSSLSINDMALSLEERLDQMIDTVRVK
ncbi:hypothetical protein DXG01_013303 [Tephrocybe rancida]|nr:hypothetical protein DXG01_013303 [Tephrocybe rancida]